jgi:hypothetical protein
MIDDSTNSFEFTSQKAGPIIILKTSPARPSEDTAASGGVDIKD